jgi:hypothetical protein
VVHGAANGSLHDGHALTLLSTAHLGREDHGLHSHNAATPDACKVSNFDFLAKSILL